MYEPLNYCHIYIKCISTQKMQNIYKGYKGIETPFITQEMCQQVA